MGKPSRGSEDTNSRSEHFKSKQEIQCHMIRKAEKRIMYQNIAKQADTSTVDPANHLEDAQHMGRDAVNTARWTLSEQSAEAKDTEKSTN